MLIVFHNDKNKAVSLERIEFVRQLGIHIRLSCKHHIDHAVLKISRNLDLLAKLRHYTHQTNKYLSVPH